MQFTELEELMFQKGINSLADIARTLNTTPQAVSNWKARNQVPHHVVAKISQKPNEPLVSSSITLPSAPILIEEDSNTLSDILITIAEQLKVIFITTVITLFTVVTYTWGTYEVNYLSTAKILLPENKVASSGLSGLATQFGINLQQGSTADLSNPSLFPELVKSLTFGERILDKEFYSEKFQQKLSLFKILTQDSKYGQFENEVLKRKAIENFQGMVTFKNEGSFSLLIVRADEPKLARDINIKVLDELQELSQFFTNEKVAEKIRFIKSRILAVGQELENSEQKLKVFRERNRQLSSPALILDEERFSRNVEIQKGIFLTLRQQLELANIEKIQTETVIRILDKPQLPIMASARQSMKTTAFLSIIVGFGLGILMAFVRSYVNNNDIDERRKLRRVRNFLKKKGQDIFLDRRMSGIIVIMMIIGLPFYLGHKSENPIYFGMYSSKLMLLNLIYLALLIFSIFHFFYFSKNKKI